VISYRPGTWFGIVGENATVLLPPSEKARAGTLWALVDDGAGFDDVLDALVSAGLRALPGFVLLSGDADAMRIVVRGPSKASFVTDEGDVVVEGSVSAIWEDRSVRGVTAMSIVLEESDEPLLTMHGGLIRLAALVSPGRVEPVQAPGPTASAPAPIAQAQGPTLMPPSGGADDVSGPYAAVLPFPAGLPAAPAVAAVPSSGAGPDADEGARAGQAGEPDQADAPIDAPLVAEPAGDAAEPAAGQADEPTDEPTDEPEDDLDVPVWASASSDPLTGPVDHEAWADEPTGVIPIVTEQELPAAGQAATEAPTEEPPGQSAESAAEPPAWTPQAPPSAPPAGAVPPPPPFPPTPPAPPAPPSALDVPSWGAVPSVEPDEAPQQEHPAPPTDDHDGLTRAGLPDASLIPSPPGIPGQQAAPAVTAYPVAKLEFSHGERVDVDRVVIVGRAPEAGRFSLAEQPLLVTVPSPHQEISSTHVEIRPGTGVDHGAAVVTDLGSTNGTVVVQPGLGPEELRPGVPVQLMPGALIDLGDGLTIRVTQP